MSGKKLLVASVALLAVLLVGAASTYFVMRHEREKDILPAFLEPPPGPRAPSSEAMGLRLGAARLHEVEALLRARGLTCKDTSARALLSSQRARKKAEIEERLQRGEGLDGITGASVVNHRSKMERNPQVRLSCEGAPAEAFGDRPRAPGRGRWLFVFDSPEHPLRHVSFRRTMTDRAAAAAEHEAAVAFYTGRFGAPAAAGSLESPDGGAPLPSLMKPVKATWTWSDLRAEVSILDFGPRGVDVNEVVEVPWPVRADAPASR